MGASTIGGAIKKSTTLREEETSEKPKTKSDTSSIKKLSPTSVQSKSPQTTKKNPTDKENGGNNTQPNPETSSKRSPDLTLNNDNKSLVKVLVQRENSREPEGILIRKEESTSSSLSLASNGRTTVTIDEKTAPSSLKNVSLSQPTSDGTPSNTKGYDNAADLIQNLLKSDVMKEVHQYFAVGLSRMDLPFATIDVVRNPGAYTAEQKTLAYMDLLYTHSRYETFKGEADKWDEGINNSNEIDQDFKEAIAILGSDKDVQSGYVKKVLDAFKLRFNWGQLTPYDSDDEADQITEREKKDAAMRPTLQSVVASFDRDIVEGGLLKKGLEAGKPPKEIMEEYNTTLGAYLSILPEEKYFDVYLNADPGLLTGPTFKERMSKAEENYKDFFVNHVVPTAPDAGTVFQNIIKAGKDNALGGRPRNIIPELEISNLKLDGPIFGNLSVDVAGLQSIANNDFDRKEGDGLKNVFRPTVEIMAKLRYPDGATSGGRVQRKIDVEAHRKAFTDAVLSQVDPLMARMAKGDMTQQQLTAYLNEISFVQSPSTPDLWKSDVISSLRGLAMGAHVLSRMPPDPKADVGSTAGNISSYSFNNISAGLTMATGLAGQSLQVYGIDGLGNQERASLERVFGSDQTGGAWSEAAFNAEPKNMTTQFWDQSLSATGKTIAVTLKAIPNVTGTVSDPRLFTREDELAAISKVVGPSAEALAASYFKENSPESEMFKTNMSTILGMVWGLTKPGGDIHTLKANITAAVEKSITTAPPTIEISRWRQIAINGATTIVNALRTSWTADTSTNATWDTIGLGTMHALGGLSALLKGGSVYASKLIPHMESMLPGEPDIINQRRVALSKTLGTASKVVGNAAGFGYAPIEIFQLAKSLNSGGNPVDLALMGIGTAADTVLAVSSLAGLGEGLINSTWLSRIGSAASTAGRVVATTAPFRFFTGIVASTVFTTASAISWIAWGGYSIWQLIKSENKYNNTKDALDNDMNRLIGTRMSFYAIKSRDTDRNGVPYKDDDAQRVMTPIDWSYIRSYVEWYRQSQGWADWKIPTD